MCKLRVYIGDQAYREPVYQVLGRHFGEVHPCSTGLIMRGFARPEILFEIDLAVARARGTPHQRFRKFETRQQYKDGQDLRCKFCMAVRAGDRLYLRGRPAARWTVTLSAMGMRRRRRRRRCRTSRSSLRKPAAASTISARSPPISPIALPGAGLSGRRTGPQGVFPVGTGLIVDGFASPRILVEIDVDAVVQD